MSTTYLGIDIGSTKICAIIAEKYSDDDSIKILGVATSESNGLRKGVVTNIDLASSAIREVVDNAKRMAGKHYEKVLVSVSGAYANSVDSAGIVNNPNHDIGLKEINRAMYMADRNANISSDYEKLHVLPYMFKVDDQEDIENPLGMTGTRLEVLVHIITVQKSSLNNLKKAVKSAGIKIDNMVLSGYASAIATLDNDEKELGVCLIDMGGDTCDIVMHIGNSLRYNDIFKAGSFNITSDLSTNLHTPIPAAEILKKDYVNLEEIPNDDKKKLKVMMSVLGDEEQLQEIDLIEVSRILSNRVQETLEQLSLRLENSDFKDRIGAGVVLTGGYIKLKGIRELASEIFGNLSVRLAKPKHVDGLSDILDDPSYSTALGLVMYGSGSYTPYEIDSNKLMRHKEEVQNKDMAHEDFGNIKSLDFRDNDSSSDKDSVSIPKIAKEDDKDNWFKRFYHRLTQIF